MRLFVLLVGFFAVVIALPTHVRLVLPADSVREADLIFSNVKSELEIPLSFVNERTRSLFLPSGVNIGENFRKVAQKYGLKIVENPSLRGRVHSTSSDVYNLTTEVSPTVLTQGGSPKLVKAPIYKLRVVFPADIPNQDWKEVISSVTDLAFNAMRKSGCSIGSSGDLYVGRDNSFSVAISGLLERCTKIQQDEVVRSIALHHLVANVHASPIPDTNLNWSNKFHYSNNLDGVSYRQHLESSKRGEGLNVVITDFNFGPYTKGLPGLKSSFRACEKAASLGVECMADDAQARDNGWHGSHCAGIVGLEKSYTDNKFSAAGDDIGFEGMANKADLTLVGAMRKNPKHDPSDEYSTAVPFDLMSFSDIAAIWNAEISGLSTKTSIFSSSVGFDPSSKLNPFQAFIPYMWSYQEQNDGLDAFHWLNPLTLGIVAAGNTANTITGGICNPAFGQNILSVGATVNSQGIKKLCGGFIKETDETPDTQDDLAGVTFCGSSSAQSPAQAAASEFPYSPAPYSASGPTVDGRYRPQVSAIGGPVISMGSNGYPMGQSGTSMAAPNVAAMIAAAVSDGYTGSSPLKGCTLSAVAIATSRTSHSGQPLPFMAGYYVSPAGGQSVHVRENRIVRSDTWNVQRGYGVVSYVDMKHAFTLANKTFIEGYFVPSNAKLQEISPTTELDWMTFNQSQSGAPSEHRLAKFAIRPRPGNPNTLKVVLSYPDNYNSIGKASTRGFEEVTKDLDLSDPFVTEDDNFVPPSPAVRVNELDLFVVLHYPSGNRIRTPAPYARNLGGDTDPLYKRELTENNQVVWLSRGPTEVWPSKITAYVAARRVTGNRDGKLPFAVAVNPTFTIDKAVLDATDLAPGGQCFGKMVGHACDCGNSLVGWNFEDCSLKKSVNPIKFTLAPFEKAYFSVPTHTKISVEEKGSRRNSRHFDPEIPIMPFAIEKLRRFAVFAGSNPGVVPDPRSAFSSLRGAYSLYHRDVKRNVFLSEYVDFAPTAKEKPHPVEFPPDQPAFSQQVAKKLEITTNCSTTAGVDCVFVVTNWDGYYDLDLAVTGEGVEYLGVDIVPTIFDMIMDFVTSAVGISCGIILLAFIVICCICCNKDDEDEMLGPVGAPMPSMGPPMMSMGPPMASMGPPMGSMRPPAMSYGGPPRPTFGGGRPPAMSFGGPQYGTMGGW